MAKWKFQRQTFGTEEFTFSEGDEVTIGRGLNNKIPLSSLVISRNHCIVKIQKDHLLLTDLKSANGVYVGTKKIAPNSPYVIKDSDTIGIGWTAGVPLSKIQDNEKFVFKVSREPSTVSSRILFQNDPEFHDIEEQIANLDGSSSDVLPSRVPSPIIEIKPPMQTDVKPPLKRKIEIEISDKISNINEDVITILSDSESDLNAKKDSSMKKPKLEPISEEPKESVKNEINFKTDNEYLEFEAFNVKQEYLGYEDEPILIESESDSESEHWYLRLSQSSPGKPFTKIVKRELNQDDNSYSQVDDDLGGIGFLNEEEEEDYLDDLVKIPPQPPIDFDASLLDNQSNIVVNQVEPNKEIGDIVQDEIKKSDLIQIQQDLPEGLARDEIDGFSSKNSYNELKCKEDSTNVQTEAVTNKTTQLIEPQVHLSKKHSITSTTTESKPKSSSSRHEKHKKHSSKRQISNSQKEERKKKLKEIAIKAKENDKKSDKMESSTATKGAPNIKITSSNRGAFLTDAVQIVKPMKRKDSPHKSRKTDKGNSETSSSKEISQVKASENTSESKNRHSEKKDKKSEHYNNVDNKKKSEKKEQKSKHKHDSSKDNTKTLKKNTSLNNTNEARLPLKSLKPLTDSEDSFAGKPFSKVDPLPPQKPKKSVRFSEAEPEVRYFEIEEGNQMKKTSLVKTTLVDNAAMRQLPIFSLERITLMKILRWNPHWLEEQINNNEPPPILGHHNVPLAILHSFASHNQYVQLIGDLLLMEIWECLSISYMKIRDKKIGLQMRIASLPPVPTQERQYDIFSISVDISLPSSDLKTLPRVGEILLVTFGLENDRNRRFFFVRNVKALPSPTSNRNSFYNLSLDATFTSKMSTLRRGELMIGINLAYINKELSLFEAMSYMGRSPLSEAILRPEPRHFLTSDYINPNISMPPQWTMTLNPSQQAAVSASVSAALSDQPCIQMVQGPPGTGKSGVSTTCFATFWNVRGKSSVICAIVMSYFYDSNNIKYQNRGKILICATSNAAVDELVIRLLNIRQKLPKAERFRMVRVGRSESMHPRARDVSSQQLAQRDAARLHEPSVAAASHPGLAEEICHLEAKINMWRAAESEAAGRDDMRVAYCQGKIAEVARRIQLLRTGTGGVGAAGGAGGAGGGELRPEELALAERRIVEGADIVVTTLASAQNHKMKGLKRRIALCIVDEAGQAIEPETLIPLTLDVTKLTLIGDPQQLPGYICSQRAKKHGLAESLFARLSSCSEMWPGGGPVVLLNEQYRMHEHIADYPNRAFYAGQIRTVAPARPALPVPPYCIVGISSGDKGQNASGANEMESWGVSRLAGALAAALRGGALSLAVITPYNAHKDLIKRNLRTLQDPSAAQVEVNTVDSFQGQERDVVVVSLARSHGVGFLTDAGRMNVMLTRARHALLVCLNPHAVVKNFQWRTLLEDAQRRKLFKSLPCKMCQASGQISNDEILKYVSM